MKPQTVPPTSGSDLQGRASHKTIIYDDYLYVVGGYTFGAEAKEKIYRLLFVITDWEIAFKFVQICIYFF